VNISISTYTLFSMPVQEAVEELIQRGWKSIEIMGDGDHHGKLLFQMDEVQLQSIANFAQENEVTFGLHLPIAKFNPATFNEETLDTWNKCLPVIQKLQVKYVLLHLGKHVSTRQGMENVVQFIQKMLVELPKNTKVVIENVPNEEYSIGTSVDELIEIINRVQSDRLFIMFDTGHGFMNCESDEEFMKEFEKATDYLFGLHISDNHGEEDEHLGIGEGKISFKQLFLNCKELKLELVLETNSVQRAEQSRQEIAQYLNMLEGTECRKSN
jgi:sugar phosphate isomerase/epimerase